MKRLRGLPQRLPTPAPRLAGPQTAGTGFRRTDGLSSTQRGYGADWRRVRAAHLASEPHCRMCRAEGRLTAAREVDHIQAFHGVDDPLRLADSNLRSLCIPHHRARTARQAHGVGGV